MRYVVLMHGNRATCPACNGIMTKQYELLWKCFDCGEHFKIVSEGQTEGEMVCEQIESSRERT